MHIGILIADFRTAGAAADLFSKTAAAAEAAERVGVHSISVMDHFHQHALWDRNDPMPEAYVILGGLAARTSRVRLGTLVTGVTYRNPALLAKMVTTLDVVSEGRAFLGLGASWLEDEFLAYGYGEAPLPVRERVDRLEEALEICRSLLREGKSTFSGRYYQTRDALNYPRSTQPGGPPILVGGAGERRLLRMVAQYADASNILGDPITLRHKLAVLDQHCEDVGRDPADVRRTHTCMAVIAPTAAEAERRLAAARGDYAAEGHFLVGDPTRVAEQAAQLFELGLDEIMLFTDRLWDDQDIGLLGEVLEQLGIHESQEASREGLATS